MNMYHCQHCRADVLPILDRGAEKVRRFRSGWVARYLACGHLAPATLQPVTVPIVAKVRLRATFGRGPKP